MYRYLFGPVPSRRLGLSLGVDLVPHKVCTFDCVYCECGPTTLQTLERREYVPASEVMAELDHFLGSQPRPDYITFSGSGEPTLNTAIGRIIEFLKSDARAAPVAVLTNGSLLYQAQVRKDLMLADVVLPSLDAALVSTFERIDRPLREFDLERYLQGLVDFRREYRGQIWLEIMVLPGYNDNPQDLELLKEAVLRIGPDRVQLNTLDRPGAVEGLRAATREELLEIVKSCGLDNVDIISATASIPAAGRKDVQAAILEMISRRPCTAEDLERVLGLKAVEVKKILAALEVDGRVEAVRQARGVFYRLRQN
jgi:wyosine [tRNA(Phe)-imidazoG37] synthetase (radical SAM superfamily)